MKKPILLVTFLFASVGSFAQNAKAWTCVSAADAEKLAGQPVKLVENATETVDGVPNYLCTYVTTSYNAETGRLGNVYSMAEEFKDAKAAQKTMADFVAQNKGMKKLTGVGDEGYSFADPENFQLVMFRKGNKLIRIRTNKVKGFKGNIDKLVGVAKGMAGSI